MGPGFRRDDGLAMFLIWWPQPSQTGSMLRRGASR